MNDKILSKLMHTILAVAMFIFGTSCATPALWDATDPNEYIIMAESEINEGELKAQGLDYWVDEEKRVFYVEKTDFQKFRAYTYRTIGTPIAVTIDTSLVALVVGAAVFIMYHDQGGDTQQATAYERQREQAMEWQQIENSIDILREEERNNPDSPAFNTRFESAL